MNGSDANGTGEYPREWDDVSDSPDKIRQRTASEEPTEWRGEERRTQLARYADRLHDAGFDPHAIAAKLDHFNATVCKPPLPETEVSRIDETARRLEYSHYGDVDDTPPKPLELDMLEPEGQTILYGPGGTGKGVTVACLTKRAQALGRRVMIFDAEQRPREWARRFTSLGVKRDKVVRLEPKDLPAHLLGKPLYEIIPHLGRIVRKESVDILFIDSILAGMGVGEEKLRSDAQAPYLVSRALDAIGITTCCIGHTPRATPDGDPYGSVAWVNAFRLTWQAMKAEGPGHRVRWKPRKRNERGQLPTSLWSFTWDEYNRVTDFSVADDSLVMRDWIRMALSGGGRSVDDLADERLTDTDDVTPTAIDRVKASIRQTLNRMKRDREVEKESGRGGLWKMRK